MKKNVDTSTVPLILAVETSGRTGSVAIANGPNLLGQTAFSAPMKHSAEILPAITALLEQAGKEPGQIDQIYISVGPGSFTGLRIAVTIAKTMSFACDTKIVAVDTLDAIAENAADYMKEKNADLQKIATILDAKRGRFFVAVYENQNGNWQKTVDDCVMSISQFVEKFANPDQPISLIGEGLVYYRDKFKSTGIDFIDESYWAPKAEKVLQLGRQKAAKGQFTDALKLQPAYLRRPDIGKKKQAKI